MSAAPRRSCSPFDAAGVVGVAGVASIAGVPSLAGVLSRASVPSRAGIGGIAGVVGVAGVAGIAGVPGVPSLAGVPSRAGVAGVAALIRRQTRYSERGRPRPHPAATRPQPTATSPAGPHPVACPLSHRSPAHTPPGHTPPPNGGFCTIRRIATACRRRVAALMLQFPPFARAGTTATPSSAPPSPQAHASNATPPQPRPHGAASPAAPGNNAPGARGPPSWPHPVACPPGHRPPGHTPPPNGGFCTIRRTATACRRRVAPLMAQFPPHTTPSTAPTATSDGSPGHGLGPASRPPPPAETSDSSRYSDKEKSNQFTSFKLSQTNV